MTPFGALVRLPGGGLNARRAAGGAVLRLRLHARRPGTASRPRLAGREGGKVLAAVALSRGPGPVQAPRTAPHRAYPDGPQGAASRGVVCPTRTILTPS